MNFYYNENGENIPFGTYKVTLSTPITFYNSQLRAFNYIHKQLSLDRQLIYNIYGETCTGKSWILKRLQEDLVSKYDDNSKTIYISFNGSMQDIRALCRLIFTLIFDYYNLGISGEALDRYCQSIGERTSIFSYDKINTLINALKHDLYHEAENILMHCIELDEYPLFEYLDSFAWRKIYIIDNIHLLNDNSKKIFRRILESFQSQKQIIFIISSRKKLDIDTCDNYELQKLQNDEILSLLNQRLNVPVNDLTEILPEDNQLGYPVIINQFLNELGENISNHYLRDYYAKNFSKTAIHYLTTKTFSFSWTAPLVVVFLVNVGVDSAILMNYQPQSYWSDLLEQDIITLNHGEFCANYLVSEKEIQHALKKYSVECEKLLFELLETTENPARYRNAIFKYCPRYYNQLWKEQFNEIKKKHHANCYHEVRELCNATLINKNYFHGSACEMRQVEYLQAFSYMHCNSSEEALPMLQSILKEYNNHSTKDTLYYTVYSEIIDAQYWTWKNYNTMASDINKYRKDWTKNHENLQLENRAYLTVTNRMMVYLLAEDKLSQAERWMKKNLRLAVQFSSKEHIGYTLMDFAKGIYHVDLNKALRYLNEAEEIFRNSGNEQRRLLDCQCEIAYVKVLLNLTDAQELKDAASALYQNQYWIQYYKSNIKLICAYLIQNNLSEAKKLLVQAKNSIIISESIRCEYLLSILATIIDNRFEKNTFEQADVPRSYRTLITHNQQSNKDMYQIYQKNLFSDMFYLDPRIW